MKPDKVVLILLALLLLARLVTVCWSLDKGIDITDEGFYLLSYHYPETDTHQQTDFNLVVNMWFGWTGLSLVTIRVLRIILELAGLFTLTWGISSFLKSRAQGVTTSLPSFPLLFFFSASGLYLSLFSRGLYYDHLTMFYTFTAVGFLLRAAAVPRYGAAWMVLSGFMAGWLWMTKMSSAILFASVILFGLLLFPAGLQKAKRMIWMALFIAGNFLVMALFLLYIGQTPGFYIDDYSRDIELLGYVPDRLFTNVYLPDFLEIAPKVLSALLVFFLYLLIRKRKYGEAMLASLVMICALLLVFDHPAYEYLTYKAQSSALVQSSHIYTLLFFCLLWPVLKHRKKIFTANTVLREMLLLVMLLFILPLVMMAGTDTVFTVSRYTYLSALFPALILLAFLVRPFMGKIAFRGWMAFIVLLSVAHFSGFFLFSPYRIHNSLFAQTETVKGPRETFQMDPESAQMVQKVRALLAGTQFSEGSPMIAMNDLPGLVYLSGSAPAGTYWYYLGEDAYNCNRMMESLRRGEKPYLLVSQKISPGTQECVNDVLQQTGGSEIGSFRNVYTGEEVKVYNPEAKR